MRRKATAEEIEKNKKDQKMRARGAKAARRGGKPVKTEGRVSKAAAKSRTPRSQKKIATIKKRRQ